MAENNRKRNIQVVKNQLKTDTGLVKSVLVGRLDRVGSGVSLFG